jgi:hypothetical protein
VGPACRCQCRPPLAPDWLSGAGMSVMHAAIKACPDSADPSGVCPSRALPPPEALSEAARFPTGKELHRAAFFHRCRRLTRLHRPPPLSPSVSPRRSPFTACWSRRQSRALSPSLISLHTGEASAVSAPPAPLILCCHASVVADGVPSCHRAETPLPECHPTVVHRRGARAASGRSRPMRAGFPTGTHRCRSSKEAHALVG